MFDKRYINGPQCVSQIADRLWLGSYFGADKYKQLNQHGIDFHVNCTSDEIQYRKPVEGVAIGFDDGEPIPEDKFWQATGAIFKAMIAGKTVLVHCHAGISRSPTIVTSYLYLTGVFTFDKALALVVEKRPIVAPHFIVMNSAKKHLKLWPHNGDYEAKH